MRVYVRVYMNVGVVGALHVCVRVCRLSVVCLLYVMRMCMRVLCVLVICCACVCMCVDVCVVRALDGCVGACAGVLFVCL